MSKKQYQKKIELNRMLKTITGEGMKNVSAIDRKKAADIKRSFSKHFSPNFKGTF